MRFHPLTEEEIKRLSFLPDGLYSYQVTGSQEKIDRNGKDYMALTLRVFDTNGFEHIIFVNMFIKLLKHFCDANNMQEEYNSGDIPEHKFLNKSGGKVQIGFEDEKQNPKGGTFKAKNIVKDFVLIDEIITNQVINNSEFKDSDISF
jgi:hypothetical protein